MVIQEVKHSFTCRVKGLGCKEAVVLCWWERDLPSSETQGQLVGAGKSLNGRGKKSGEEKSRMKIGAPGILLLTDQFRNHLKSLPVIGHKNIFVPNQSPALFVLLS